MEEMLILSDVGVNVATQLTEDLRYEARLENVKKTEDLQRLIIENLWISRRRMMSTRSRLISKMFDSHAFRWCQRVGKTTSIGKLAHKYKQEGKKSYVGSC